MCAWLAVIVLMGEPGALATGGFQSLVANPPGSPPIVGRPVDFSGAIGGPFVVQWVAVPSDVVAEEPLTLTLRVTGPGNLAAMPRPPLGKQDAFKPFAVEDLDDRFVPGDPPRREFRYRVRPRTAEAKEVPRFKFVYFNPHVVPASRGFQTTYADAVPLTVIPRTTPAPPEVPEWLIREWETKDDEFQQGSVEQWRNALFVRLGLDPYPEHRSPAGWLIPAIAAAGPPLVCGAWYAVWRRRHPDAARLAGQRRSRATAVALRELQKATDDAGGVHTAVCEYLRSRFGLPATATTPAEVDAFLRNSGVPADEAVAVEGLLRRCDQARFSAEHPPLARLSADAERLILDLEAAP
jgi:hypothetical protein